MSVSRCLYCYKSLVNEEVVFHKICARKIFGSVVVPELAFDEGEIQGLAEKVIRSQFALTGVQPKLSLDIEKKHKDAVTRFTIVGLWGNYILKPPTDKFHSLPEIEDLTMHLAELSGIATVPHTLIRLTSGNLAYLTKRVDRNKKNKLHMEDMCQLTERLTEHKYHGSYEQVGEAILRHSQNPGLDTINFFEQVLFSFLTGNADMHLKNFSLLNVPGLGYSLSPAYDHVATKLLMPEDDEDLALTLNGKKKKIKKADFEEAATKLNISIRSRENSISKFKTLLSVWKDFVNVSFLSEELKIKYIELLESRWSRIF
ncbi:type II toxin-antitoxin system HipA family toxin [Chryseotalea sanaruensis]|uniref:Type II toxin-antitoxin system HipA family toxin n=1 Tax=Chryseotalea sanaruensis TaxID=2482724 RepID=A0A401UC82_9BACT|nr:HipA domain-containing protein [Chryseotalea sanaruensis]GCC52485.1 type II toxin-antitoxin system HipA family toxin [Chryseotalea sanaruensis]